MGSWDETCELSLLPIVGGDEVILVDFNRQPSWGFQLLPKDVIRIEKGYYNGYGGLEGKEIPCWNQVIHRCFFHKEIWGLSISDTENVFDSESFEGLIKLEQSMNKMQQLAGLEVDNTKLDLLLSIPYKKEIEQMLYFAYKTRRSLDVGIIFRGCQHSDYADYKKLNAKISELLLNKINP